MLNINDSKRYLVKKFLISKKKQQKKKKQGLGSFVHSNVSLTSSVVVKMLTVLVSTICNSQVFLLKNVSSFCKSYSHIFSKNISKCAIFIDQIFNDTLINDIVSFEQIGPDFLNFNWPIWTIWRRYQGNAAITRRSLPLAPKEGDNKTNATHKTRTHKQRRTARENYHLNKLLGILTLPLLNTTRPVLSNSVHPDQLASEEANWSASALFVIKYVNFYQKFKSSNLIGRKLEVTVAS